MGARSASEPAVLPIQGQIAKLTKLLALAHNASRDERAAPARLAPLPRAYVPRPLPTNLSRRSSNYHRLWLQLGMPPGMPAPYPFCNSSLNTNGHRYTYVSGTSSVLTRAVAAGENAHIFCFPHRASNPLAYYETGASGTTGVAAAAIACDAFGAGADRTAAATATADWRGSISPWDFYGDTEAIKSGAVYNVPGANSNSFPPVHQLIGHRLVVQVSQPYNANSTAFAVSPGDLGNLFCQTSDGIIGQMGGAGNPCHIRLGGLFIPVLHRAGSITPLALSQTYGTPRLLSGGTETASRTYIISGMPTRSWCYAGALDSTDAPDAAQTSFSVGVYPRDNIASVLSNGWFSLYNTGAAAVTIVAHLEAVFAVVIPGDDSTRAVSALAATARLSAPTLQRNEASAIETPKTAEASTLDQAQVNLARGAPPELVEIALKPKPAITSTSHTGTFINEALEFLGEGAVWEGIKAVAKAAFF